jgi:hypothetical protein
MGFTWMREHTGQFSDRHKQDNVRYYQEKYYVPEWMKLKPRMQSWDSEGQVIPPKLNEGEQHVIVWFHNESIFYAHDQQLTQ